MSCPGQSLKSSYRGCCLAMGKVLDVDLHPIPCLHRGLEQVRRPVSDPKLRESRCLRLRRSLTGSFQRTARYGPCEGPRTHQQPVGNAKISQGPSADKDPDFWAHQALRHPIRCPISVLSSLYNCEAYVSTHTNTCRSGPKPPFVSVPPVTNLCRGPV